MRKILCAVMIAAAAMGAAQAADIPVLEATPPARAVYVPTYVWSGVYLGGYGGGRWARIDDATGASAASVSGWAAGGVVGFNFQVGDFVYGLDGDFGVGNSSGGNLGAGGVIQDGDIRASGHLRARAGWTADRFMLFVAGGGTMANPFVTRVGLTPIRNWVEGWTVGTGVEYAVLPNLVLRTEYLFAHYGEKGYTYRFVPPLTTKITVDQVHTLRAAFLIKY
jgi:outer membrane immunogenic protein